MWQGQRAERERPYLGGRHTFASLHPGCEFERGIEGGKKTREEERIILCSRVTEGSPGTDTELRPFSRVFLCCCDSHYDQNQLEEDRV